MIAWDAVTLDCASHPESAIVYQVRETRKQVAGSVIGPDGESYPIYAPLTWSRVDETANPWSAYDPPTPSVGEAVFWSVDAVDEAGNSSEDCT